jgi:hypothetical protein
MNGRFSTRPQQSGQICRVQDQLLCRTRSDLYISVSSSLVRSIDRSIVLTPRRHLLASLYTNVLLGGVELFTTKTEHHTEGTGRYK